MRGPASCNPRMPTYEQTTWLSVSEGKHLVIHDHGRFAQIVRSLEDPRRQYPGLVHFVGSSSKVQAVRHLFPRLRTGPRLPNALLNLRLDSTSSSDDHPVLISDSNLHVDTRSSIQTRQNHGTAHHLSWSPESLDSLYDVVHARLIFLFSDVVCVFADDFGGLDALVPRITEWVRLSPKNGVKPFILIVVSEAKGNVEREKSFLGFRDRVRSACPLDQAFAGVRIYSPEQAHLGPSAVHKLLRDVIKHEMQVALQRRRDRNILFPATLQSLFFSTGVSHLAGSRSQDFDFLAAARKMFIPSDDHLTQHVRNLLQQGDKKKMSLADLAYFVASTLMIQAYPPEMHCEALHMRSR